VYGLSVISGPSEEPVSLDRAKTHLRVDHDVEDDLIQAWIVAAREITETHTDRRWIAQTLRLTLADWPCEWIGGAYGAVCFPVSPVSSVDTVAYYATDGTLTELDGDAGDWQEFLDHAPPLIAPPPVNNFWPVVQTGRLGAVRIEFTAGYADADAVPEQVKAAMLLCLGYWYENRGDGMDLTMMNGLPQSLGMPPGAKRLLDGMAAGGYW
jgi:uncharacterized phiE125 gp8 family phage protein